MKRGKIQLFLDSLAAHPATRKEGFVFIFFENFQFSKKIKTNLPLSRRSVAHQKTRFYFMYRI
jgi:hypothetical protein